MAEKVKQYRLPDDPITLDELKSFLWAAATHLRGQIDAAGYKEYIFPLLFFKRISDVYDGDKEYNLSPNRYVVYHKEEIRPYAEVLAEFKQAYEDVKRLENEFSLLINA